LDNIEKNQLPLSLFLQGFRVKILSHIGDFLDGRNKELDFFFQSLKNGNGKEAKNMPGD